MADTTPHAQRFDVRELAGAFGDLGTFVPFVLAYIAVAKMDSGAVLLVFGVALIATGAVFRTPMPVQPMKALGAAAAVQSTQAVTLAAVQAASLITGLLWILLAATGLTTRMMNDQLWLGLPLLAVAFVLVAARGAAVMLLLLVCGIAYALWHDPALVSALEGMRPAFRLPGFGWPELGWRDLWIGAVVLALPQLPLTLGNALVATVEQNNRLFPDRPTSLRSVAASTGLMNLWSAAASGVPMCHGAGGMAGKVSFGARSGAAPAFFGALLMILALFFSASVETLLRLFPAPVLGVILFLAGAQLALGICELGPKKSERFVTVITAALCLWNVGAAFVLGLALHVGLKRDIVKL